MRSRREKNQGASATLQLKRRRLRENKPESHWKSPKEGEKVIDEASRWADDRTDRERCEQLIAKSVYRKVYLSNFAFTLLIFRISE